ncbi:MAG TPA: hypothetical protein VF226_11480 [Hyphomicrobiaceae bacterium]|jgi:hypothetical protein
MMGRVLVVLPLVAAYVISLAILFRFFTQSRSSHVLVLECKARKESEPENCNRNFLSNAFPIALAVGLLFAEAGALVLLAEAFNSIPADLSANIHLMLHYEPMLPGRSAALAILICSSSVQLLARRFIRASVAYPVLLLLTGIISFGAAVDIIFKGLSPAPAAVIFQVAGCLQIMAAAAFGLGALILGAETLAGLMHAALAQAAGAGVRLLGVIAMLSIWSYLPPASAVALLLAGVLVPGAATALTSIAALATTP